MSSQVEPSTNVSTASLQSNTTTTSTTYLRACHPGQAPQKDYSAAFAALQSRYGTSGNVPNPKPTNFEALRSGPSDSTLISTTGSLSAVSKMGSPFSDSGTGTKKKGLVSMLKDKVKPK